MLRCRLLVGLVPKRKLTLSSSFDNVTTLWLGPKSSHRPDKWPVPWSRAAACSASVPPLLHPRDPLESFSLTIVLGGAADLFAGRPSEIRGVGGAHRHATQNRVKGTTASSHIFSGFCETLKSIGSDSINNYTYPNRVAKR